jgi:hypothetical protein
MATCSDDRPCNTAVDLMVKQSVFEEQLKAVNGTLSDIRDDIRGLRAEQKIFREEIRPNTFKVNLIWSGIIAISASALTLGVFFLRGVIGG